MPAGGIWTAQNKKRPGAYINFKSVPKPVGTIGSRGVIACALPMTWGPTDKLITLYGEDLLNGKSIPKIGCDAFDTAESLPYRLALSGCYKALIYRTDAGGVKATTSVATTLTVTAKYSGSTGNNISVVITKDKPAVDKYTVEVLFKRIKKETFVISAVADFETLESEWVDFIASGETIPETVGATLEGGTNGTVTNNLSTFFNLIGGEIWQCVAVNSTDTGVQTSIVEFVKLMIQQRGKKVQGIVYDYNAADYEGIISVNQGYVTESDTVTVELFPLYAASITAGANINESNTARVVEGAVSIINPINEEDIEDALAVGKFLLTYRQDGAVCIEKDINTLHTLTADKGYEFSKNRIMRCLNDIGNNTALIFNRNYCGKMDNDEDGRKMYKSELISMMDQYADIGAITNFAGADDITVLPGADIDSVVVELYIQPVDSMEKLYMTVNVNG